MILLVKIVCVMCVMCVGAQMVMTDVSSRTQRADALGKLSVSYGVGMVVGPTLGGYVVTWFSMHTAALVAGALCLVSMVLVLMFVPATTKDPAKISRSEKVHGKGLPIRVLSRRGGGGLLHLLYSSV